MDIASPSAGGAVSADQYQVAVAKKVMDSTRVQGEQSVELIQAAAAPRNLPAGVGQLLNVRA